jgi:hypothetical protein
MRDYFKLTTKNNILMNSSLHCVSERNQIGSYRILVKKTHLILVRLYRQASSYLKQNLKTDNFSKSILDIRGLHARQ